MILRTFVRYVIIIINSKVRIVGHCSGNGHEAMICVVCPVLFLLTQELSYLILRD